MKAYSVVKIKQLNKLNRHFDGTEGVMRMPTIGDVGTIVQVLDENHFIIECVDRDGMTVWIADFEKTELIAVQ